MRQWTLTPANKEVLARHKKRQDLEGLAFLFHNPDGVGRLACQADQLTILLRLR